MSNDTDMFFNACQCGFTQSAQSWLVGRSAEEKREGVLICYEYGHQETGDVLLGSLTFSQVSACLEKILTSPTRFVRISATAMAHRIVTINTNNRGLMVHSMAANNFAIALQFLIDNNYIDIKSHHYADQILVAARCTSLQALDLLSPPAQRSEKDLVRIINSVLECSDVSTVMRICTQLPPTTYNTALYNAIRNKNDTLLEFLIQSVTASQADPSVLLSTICHECLRNNWSEPVHEYAHNNPSMLPGIFQRIKDMGAAAGALFVPFLSYYEKHLLSQNLADQPSSTPTIARKM